MKTWKIIKIVWVVIDVEFEDWYIPWIYEALEIKGNSEKVVLEVQQQLGDGVVRTIAMNPIDGLKRGLEVIATESPISIPVGDKVLGRMFNVLGDPIDNKAAPKTEHRDPIHRDAPEFSDLTTKAEVLKLELK